MGKWFFGLYQYLNKHRILTMAGLALLLAALLWSVSKITFEEDISKLIPVNSDTKDIQRVLRSVNFTDKIIVNISSSKGPDVDGLVEYATEFTDSLEADFQPYIKYLRGKVDEGDLIQTMDFVYNNLPLLLEKEDYEIIQNKIQPDSITAITESNYRTLISPSGIVTKDIILRDPLGLSFIALKKLRQLGVSDEFVLKDGFLVSKDEKNILLFISPSVSSSETAANTVFAAKLYALQKNLDLKYDGISSEYFGASLIAVANANQIKHDIQFTVGIAFTLLILVFVFFYRKIYIPFVLFIPTLFGSLLAMAILFLVRDEISAISLGIGSVLLGVTLDYSLHILTHIRNNESPRVLYKDVTEPVLMSSLTTAMAFFCLLFLDSQALQDLGLFAGFSVLGAAIFALIIIPLFYKNPESQGRPNNILDKVAAYNFHKNKWLLMGLGMLILVGFFTYKRVGFDQDISKMNYEPQEIKEAMAHLEELTDISSKSIYLATYGKSVEGTLQLNDSIHERLELLKSNGKIGSFSNIGALVHSQRDQRERLARWNSFWVDAKKDSVEHRLKSSGNTLGFKPETFNRFYDFLDRDFHTLKPEDYQQVPAMLLEDFIATETDFTTITTLIKLEDDNADQIKAAFKDFPNTLVIDRQEMNETFLGNLRNDFNSLIGYCLLAVVLVIFAFFRSFSLTIVAATPIFLTWFLILGIMGLLDIHFNIFNIIISTFIFGLGVDYSIFMTKGLLKRLQTGEQVMVTYKTSIMLSVLTTILGVGVLIFAKHPALYSISMVSVIGIFSAMVTSFALQPLLFHLLVGSRKKVPIKPRMLLHSVISFGYFGLGGILVSIYVMTILPLLPYKKEKKKYWLHKTISSFMKSVLYTNPFVKKRIINDSGEDFSKPAVIIANHTSFLDILAVGMLHPKICFLVKDWVYYSPIFGKVVQHADFYPVSRGIENSREPLQKEIEQGYSLMAFPEGTRSATNKIKRFHKGAFYLANELKLDILPVLIHGTSEVNPKGSFIIDDGSITVEILPRIKFGENDFGDNHTQQAKKIGSYFRQEYLKMRRRLESPSYFHRQVLKEYRYKDNELYQKVKRDLRQSSENYYQILIHLGQDDKIGNLCEDYGQLDFLLASDGPDRRVYSYIPDDELRLMLQNSHLTQKSGNLHFLGVLADFKRLEMEVLIVNTEDKLLFVHDSLSFNAQTLVVLLEQIPVGLGPWLNSEYESVFSDIDIHIFKRIIRETGEPKV